VCSSDLYTARTIGFIAAPATPYFAGNYGTTIEFGTVAGGLTMGPAIAPEEAMYIDDKFDDGRPATGGIMTYLNTAANAPNCATTNVAATAAYNIAVDDRLCALIFLSGAY